MLLRIDVCFCCCTSTYHTGRYSDVHTYNVLVEMYLYRNVHSIDFQIAVGISEYIKRHYRQAKQPNRIHLGIHHHRGNITIIMYYDSVYLNVCNECISTILRAQNLNLQLVLLC